MFKYVKIYHSKLLFFKQYIQVKKNFVKVTVPYIHTSENAETRPMIIIMIIMIIIIII